MQWCTVGRLAAEMGWKYQEIVGTLEDKRRTRAAEFYDAKKKSLVRTHTACTLVAGFSSAGARASRETRSCTCT